MHRIRRTELINRTLSHQVHSHSLNFHISAQKHAKRCYRIGVPTKLVIGGHSKAMSYLLKLSATVCYGHPALGSVFESGPKRSSARVVFSKMERCPLLSRLEYIAVLASFDQGRVMVINPGFLGTSLCRTEWIGSQTCGRATVSSAGRHRFNLMCQGSNREREREKLMIILRERGRRNAR